MPHEHHEQIEQVVTSILEQMAFVFADPAQADELPPQLADAVSVTLNYGGASQGRLEVTSGPELCEELAMNLGDDDADSDAGRLALMEIANVLCGQLLTTVAGGKPVFDLDPPVLTSTSDQAWREMRDDPKAVTFFVDDCPIVVRFDAPVAA